MQTFLIVVSSALTIASILPYAVETIKGKTKPRIVSWLTWSLLTGIACAAAFADGQIPTGILLLLGTIETFAIVVLGWRYGDRKFERFDIICQVLAIVGIILWQIFDSPEIAVIAALTLDFIGAMPTIRHSWKKPFEETWLTFALAAGGAFFTILASKSWEITAIAFPIYLVAINSILTGTILLSPNRKLKGEPKELRDL